MSIEVFDVEYKNKNNELKTEGAILLDYLNVLARKCRKTTKGKTYDELDEGESFDRFQNRLGFFEDKLNYTISEMIDEISYKAHKERLTQLQDENCLYSWEYTEDPMNDLNTYVKCLRKKVKAVIKIYEQHDLRNVSLIRGYHYYKNY